MWWYHSLFTYQRTSKWDEFFKSYNGYPKWFEAVENVESNPIRKNYHFQDFEQFKNILQRNILDQKFNIKSSDWTTKITIKKIIFPSYFLQNWKFTVYPSLSLLVFWTSFCGVISISKLIIMFFSMKSFLKNEQTFQCNYFLKMEL